MAEHLDTGAWGENKAAEHLRQAGYSILEQNYRHQHGEIDLIASRNKMLLFIEVKTRRHTAYGLPETFVTPSKVKLLKKVAEHYIFAIDWKFDIRFDIIAILIRPEGGYMVHHIEDAFY